MQSCGYHKRNKPAGWNLDESLKKFYQRSLRATWRDTALLVREFRWPLTIFLLAVILGGFLYFQLAQLAGEPVETLTEAMYRVFLQAFLQQEPLQLF